MVNDDKIDKCLCIFGCPTYHLNEYEIVLGVRCIVCMSIKICTFGKEEGCVLTNPQ